MTIDYEAVETATKALEGHIKLCEARGDKSNAALCRLRVGFVKPWLTFLQEMTDNYVDRNEGVNASLTVASNFIAGIISELATNYWDHDESDYAIEQLIEHVQRMAKRDVHHIKIVDSGGTIEDADIIIVGANLNKRTN